MREREEEDGRREKGALSQRQKSERMRSAEGELPPPRADFFTVPATHRQPGGIGFLSPYHTFYEGVAPAALLLDGATLAPIIGETAARGIGFLRGLGGHLFVREE